MYHHVRFAALAIVWGICGGEAVTAQQPATPAPEVKVSFVREIAPILSARCAACHEAANAEGGYRVDTFQALSQPGKAGARVVPGNPGESGIWKSLQAGVERRMPLKEDPLTADQLALIERWIRQGATFDGPDPQAALASLAPTDPGQRAPVVYPAPIAVTALAFTPDSKSLISSGYRELLVWEANTGKLTGRWPGLPELTSAVRVSPNGWWVASAGGTPGTRGVVRLWDATNGTPIRDLLAAPDVVLALNFSSDSKLLAAGGSDRLVHVWNLATGKPIARIAEHSDGVEEVCFSPDGQRLATASRDKTAKVFEVATGKMVVAFTEHIDPVRSVAFARDGQSVVSAGGDKIIRVWNPHDGAKKIREIHGHGGEVSRLLVSADNHLFSVSADATLRQWKLADGAGVRNFSGHADWVYSVAVSPDGQLIATGSWDGEVRVWKITDGSLVKNFPARPTAENSGSVQTAAR